MRHDDTIAIVRGSTVSALLDECRRDVVDVVREAYLALASGRAVCPHSTFLNFPDDGPERVIALPAYIGEPFNVVGLKWVASFPGNVRAGRERASAVLVLNSMESGRPIAFLDAGPINAARTAAMAGLAAASLHIGGAGELTVVGAGPINFEIVRFVALLMPPAAVHVVDVDAARATYFAARVSHELGIAADVEPELRKALAASSLASFATSASRPYVVDAAWLRAGTTVLHVSLRDLAPNVILDVDNVVDDVDHVCRENTSLHLTEQQTGHRRFIRCSLADVLEGHAPARPDPAGITVFSPFGLGVLDVAVGQFVLRRAVEEGFADRVDDFFAAPWNTIDADGTSREEVAR